MIKKFTIFAFVSLIMLPLTKVPVEAGPFLEVEGFVNPYVGTDIDNGDGTVTFTELLYTFNVTSAEPGVELSSLALEFESDVFVDPGLISDINPADWTTTLFPSLSGSTYQIATAGTTLAAGDMLSFRMLNVVMYEAALTDGTLWQEGQVWGQSWTAGDTSGFFFGGDGGSTALNPEPGSLLLFGSGLTALGLLGRKKFKPTAVN